MSKGNTRLVERNLWSAEDLETDLASAIQGFRDERLQEPLASYIAAYDSAEEVIDALLRSTGNLTTLQAEIADLLQVPGMLDA
ncbi:MAG: hypothetical protein KDE24_06950, partial [Caldilinea sp.]|nr:hypothetical protein [Caldilinea sp.]